MKTRLFLSLLLSIVCSMAFAQKTLEVEERSQANDVYSSDGDEAAIIIKCNQTIPLQFSSSMDKSADPFRTELQGSDSVYYIAFPTGNRYRGREISILSPGYNIVTIPLELNPKQLRSFYLSDPDATVGKGCYVEHRNKAQEEIKKTNYEQAKDLLLEACQCSDVDTTENNENLRTLDTIMNSRAMADRSFKLLDYQEAATYYEKVMMLNPYDNYASNRFTVCMRNYESECDVAFKKAEYFYSEKMYDKAKELYDQVVRRECNNMVIATDRLNIIQSAMDAKKYHSRVLTYEYNKDTPIGFSYGKYNMKKTGGFFQMDINNRVFDALRSDCRYGDPKDDPELNMSFGWTIKIVNPVWIYFGPGITSKLYYGTYLEDHYPGYKDHEMEKIEQTPNMTDTEYEKELKKLETKTNLAFAVSPVIGICVKYSYFAIRATYQYRWALKSQLDNYIGKSRLSFGVGVAF